ncbi:hypothetical protein HP499_03405 [Paenarthrobacter sp. CM16]|uniref:hypothetical protein n=1 Tax=Paenarthrobacter sp. CM16 TaxID=2738447 RepID=UPI001554B9D3|nr:hypothetical protein [Paenarthrobacter sp. CM16]NQD86857.1 hypothetical protein [Paenarthrobacter sp. CM16]
MNQSKDAARFWAKVSKGPRENECWLWVRAVADDGYGRFTLNGDGRTQAVRPHRFASTWLMVPIWTASGR